jgi:hypothetical protein
LQVHGFDGQGLACFPGDGGFGFHVIFWWIKGNGRI